MNVAAEHIKSNCDLRYLLQGIADAPQADITDVTADSRDVTPGALFVARQGATQHGLDFTADVLQQGAAAIVTDRVTDRDAEFSALPLVHVPDLDAKLGVIADRFFGQPSGDVDVIGVTGTNGKSSVAWMQAQSLTLLGRRCGYSGTLGYGVDELRAKDDQNRPVLTTPDVVEMHRRIAAMRDDGARAAAIEVSSHALVQGRVDEVRFSTAMFTNLSRDHLDLHGDMRAYGEAKSRLFIEHLPPLSIINADSAFGAELASRCPGDVVVTSASEAFSPGKFDFVNARDIVTQNDGFTLSLQTSWGNARLRLPLVGRFNIENALLVLAQLLATGIDINDASEVLAQLTPPPGRMQRVTQDSAVFVDYAHTPEALEFALRALAEHGSGELSCVFGCGGDRDRGKRGQMGGIAEQFSDHCILTSDNPRSEDPLRILDDIRSGMQRPDEATVIEDRAAAIAYAIQNMSIGSRVLIAGKGHEDTQTCGNEIRQFSDVAVARRCLHAEGVA